jgi:hypothetical protein
MERYVAPIRRSGSAATATIDDLDSLAWKADVRDVATFDFQPGLVTIEIVGGPRDGLFAVSELEYPDCAQMFHTGKAPQPSSHGRRSGPALIP